MVVAVMARQAQEDTPPTKGQKRHRNGQNKEKESWRMLHAADRFVQQSVVTNDGTLLVRYHAVSICSAEHLNSSICRFSGAAPTRPETGVTIRKKHMVALSREDKKANRATNNPVRPSAGSGAGVAETE